MFSAIESRKSEKEKIARGRDTQTEHCLMGKPKRAGWKTNRRLVQYYHTCQLKGEARWGGVRAGGAKRAQAASRRTSHS